MKIEHELKMNSDAPTVYQALTTQKGLESWHSARIEGSLALHGQFTLSHKNHPSFVWKMTDLTPNQQVTWECIEGPGNAPGTKVQFRLTPCADGRIFVECAHEGWSESNEHFTKCNTLWGMLLNHLKEFVEHGTINPTFH